MIKFITKMGNCLTGDNNNNNYQSSVIKVTTSNGGVMEFHSPTITVESITDEFPNHGIFRTHDLFWKPLPHCHVLLSGESYHLLPLQLDIPCVRSSSAPQHSVSAAPYRMSFDSRGGGGVIKKLQQDDAVLSKAVSYGFWKVKLVISPEKLLQILSEDGKTEELIESVRTVAKCGSVFGGGGGSSDQWSLCSSRNAASSNKDANLLEF